jgi:hypothetical protein
MKKITKFLLNVTSVGSIVSIATLNASQFAVMGQPTPPQPTPKPTTVSAGPRFIQPKEDIELRYSPPNGGVGFVRGKCGDLPQVSFTALVPENKIGRTVSDYPTFFFYLPQPNAELAEFILEDENGNLIYDRL